MIAAILVTLLWLVVTTYSYKKLNKSSLTKQDIVMLCGYFIIHFFRLEKRMAPFIQYIHSNFMLVEQIGWDYAKTIHKLMYKLGEVTIVIVVGCWLAFLLHEPILYVAVVLAVIAILFQLYHGTAQKVKQRRQKIVLELPIILTRMTLLIEAGETIPQAFIKCMEKLAQSNHSLHYEWNLAITMMQNGDSFPIVIEKFSKRCSTQPVSVLSTYLLLNYARGGSYFVTSIQDLMGELWEQRKTIARKKGEEASSKLVFPTIFILLLLMILIVTPAISLIGVI